jgi:predicted RNA binding protein YcfA (HicA-like mRNA interferase family)
MKYKEAARKLKKLGCQEISRRGSGSHRKWYNPDTDRMAPLPDWGSKDLKTGTLRAVVRQLGLDWQEFMQS